MRVDKLTSALQSAFLEAQSIALGKDHQFIEPEHLLLALFADVNSGVEQLLGTAGVNVASLKEKLNK